MTEEQTIEQMAMELIAEECRITTDEIVEYPPTALSLGEKIISTKRWRFKNTNTNWNLWKLLFCTSTTKDKKDFLYITFSWCLFKWQKQLWRRYNGT
jgi:hypothetical protein